MPLIRPFCFLLSFHCLCLSIHPLCYRSNGFVGRRLQESVWGQGIHSLDLKTHIHTQGQLSNQPRHAWFWIMGAKSRRFFLLGQGEKNMLTSHWKAPRSQITLAIWVELVLGEYILNIKKISNLTFTWNNLFYSVELHLKSLFPNLPSKNKNKS